MSEHSLGMIVCQDCRQSTAGPCAAHATFTITTAAPRAMTSPQHRIRCGLQAMARTLNQSNAWTAESREGYAAASHALDELPVRNAANPTGPTTINTKGHHDR